MLRYAADEFAEGGAEVGRIMLFDNVGAVGEGAEVRAFAAHHDDLGAKFEDLWGGGFVAIAEDDEDLVEFSGGATHEVEDADGAARGGRLDAGRRRRDMPGNLWMQCTGCSKMIYKPKVEEQPTPKHPRKPKVAEEDRDCDNCFYKHTKVNNMPCRKCNGRSKWKSK